jgi:hypothetical protein
MGAMVCVRMHRKFDVRMKRHIRKLVFLVELAQKVIKQSRPLSQDVKIWNPQTSDRVENTDHFDGGDGRLSFVLCGELGNLSGAIGAFEFAGLVGVQHVSNSVHSAFCQETEFTDESGNRTGRVGSAGESKDVTISRSVRVPSAREWGRGGYISSPLFQLTLMKPYASRMFCINPTPNPPS